jgi:nucleotide-binding universal stress UspA family protein
MRIAVCVIDSIVVYKMVDYIARLFPYAEYHLVSLITKLERRTYLTRLYRYLLENTLKQAQDNAEKILRKNNVSKIHKDVLYVKWDKFLSTYIREKNIDLIAVTSRAKVEIYSLGSTTQRIIERSIIPVLLYTPKSEILPFSETLHVLLIDGFEPPQYILDEIERKYRVLIDRVKRTEIPLDTMKYDLVIVDRHSLLGEKLYTRIWHPFLIIPM